MCYCSQYTKGEIKGSNKTREIISSLSKGFVPLGWKQGYRVSKTISLSYWIQDVILRLEYVDRYYQYMIKSTLRGKLMEQKFWIGGLFSPEAFVTATRQMAAQVSNIIKVSNIQVIYILL